MVPIVTYRAVIKLSLTTSEKVTVACPNHCLRLPVVGGGDDDGDDEEEDVSEFTGKASEEGDCCSDPDCCLSCWSLLDSDMAHKQVEKKKKKDSCAVRLDQNQTLLNEQPTISTTNE